MKQILFATGNPAKARRFSKGLMEKGIEVITLKDIEAEIDIEENGNNAVENALIKARAYSKLVKIPVFAMDDNLYLENVPEVNQPGMFVRRVNGKRLSDEEMLEHYINLVKEFGNQVSVSIPYMLYHLMECGKIKENDKVLLCGTAAGLTANILLIQI